MCALNPVSAEMWCLDTLVMHISSFYNVTSNSFCFLEVHRGALLPGLGNILKL